MNIDKDNQADEEEFEGLDPDFEDAYEELDPNFDLDKLPTKSAKLSGLIRSFANRVYPIVAGVLLSSSVTAAQAYLLFKEIDQVTEFTPNKDIEKLWWSASNYYQTQRAMLEYDPNFFKNANWGELFIDRDFLVAQVLTQQEAIQARANYRHILQKIRPVSSDINELVARIGSRFGRYHPDVKVMSTLLIDIYNMDRNPNHLDLVGNCVARSFLAASIMHDLRPDIQIAFRRYTNHVELVYFDQGVWYEITPLGPVPSQLTSRSVLIDPEAFFITEIGGDLDRSPFIEFTPTVSSLKESGDSSVSRVNRIQNISYNPFDYFGGNESYPGGGAEESIEFINSSVITDIPSLELNGEDNAPTVFPEPNPVLEEIIEPPVEPEELEQSEVIIEPEQRLEEEDSDSIANNEFEEQKEEVEPVNEIETPTDSDLNLNNSVETPSILNNILVWLPELDFKGRTNYVLVSTTREELVRSNFYLLPNDPDTNPMTTTIYVGSHETPKERKIRLDNLYLDSTNYFSSFVDNALDITLDEYLHYLERFLNEEQTSPILDIVIPSHITNYSRIVEVLKVYTENTFIIIYLKSISPTLDYQAFHELDQDRYILEFGRLQAHILQQAVDYIFPRDLNLSGFTRSLEGNTSIGLAYGNIFLNTSDSIFGYFRLDSQNYLSMYVYNLDTNSVVEAFRMPNDGNYEIQVSALSLREQVDARTNLIIQDENSSITLGQKIDEIHTLNLSRAEIVISASSDIPRILQQLQAFDVLQHKETIHLMVEEPSEIDFTPLLALEHILEVIFYDADVMQAYANALGEEEISRRGLSLRLANSN